MRIAVPYENGNIFQHFGRSEAFKFYDVADGAVTAAAVVSTNGSGHGALAGFLAANHADVVICDHHDHAHGAGHTCGEHGCGEHSCHS